MPTTIEILNTDIQPQLRIRAAALTILEQGEELLRELPAADYVEKIPQAFNASIGGHYRHCLDHFTSFGRGLASGEINYDQRDRDVRVENDPEFARHLTRRLRNEVAALTPEELNTPITTRGEVSYAAGESPVCQSSVGRELAYAIAHAIHHYALIAVMARLNGTSLPENFGMAPSTVAHQARRTTEEQPH